MSNSKEKNVKDADLKKRYRAKTLARAKSYWQLYLFLVPAILYFGIFRYIPMAGLQMAFKNYNVIQGIWGSPWAGFEHFIRFFNSPDCWLVISNTLKISILSLIFGFPLPIIVALLINQTRSKKYGKVVQTTLYAPHFISAVIIVGMLNLFLSPSTGIINQIIVKLGGESVMFMGIAPIFPIIYVVTEIWQNTGYSSIVYTAALSGVSPELHESAIMDGATIVQRIRYIDLPCIMPTIIILLIMNTGRVLTVGYEKIYLMQNSLNRSASEVISTYVYKQAFGSSSLPNFSYSAAIGFFESVVSLILLVIVNKISQKYAHKSLVKGGVSMKINIAKSKHAREGNHLFHFVNYIILTLMFLAVAYPIYFVLIASFSNPALVGTGQVMFFPKGLTIEGYKTVFSDGTIMGGYKNSIIYTVTGVVFSVITTVLAAYALSRRDLPGRKYIMMLIVFTMYFGGGMIPTYLLVRDLKLTNTMWSLVFPGLIVPYNLIVARTFFETSIPSELRESAQLDGCTEFQFFKDIAIPLSKAIVAIMVLFYGVAQWNTYFNAMIYIRDQNKYPLQLVLRNILIENQVSQELLGDTQQMALQFERAGLIKYVSIVVSAAPLMILYPFIQKYFVKGVLIGSVKG